MSNSSFEWQCTVCTLLNHIDSKRCVACGSYSQSANGHDSEIALAQQSLFISSTTQQQPSHNPETPPSDINMHVSTQNITAHHDDNENASEDSPLPSNDNEDEFENNDDYFQDDDSFEDDVDGWEDAELCYDEQKRIEHVEEEDCEQILKRALEKRRIAQSKLKSFWKCGKCQFLNHPSRAVCMMCAMPQLDVVHHIMMCPKNDLKICVRCKAFVVPHLYDGHVLDCKPIAALDNESTNQAWFVKLTACEQNAINHVNGLAIEKSNNEATKNKLIAIVKQIENGKYADKIDEAMKVMYHFLEWEVPIIIRIHIANLIPKIINDTHYRNLFEIGRGSGGNDKEVRKQHEDKMFGPVYDKAKAFERPKYGCLNIGLTDEGTQQAKGYGDGYFLMNNTTVRWRTTMTIMDSFSVNGECGTVKHCNHLLAQLQHVELQEIIEAALTKKTSSGGSKQNAYREIQVHGPVQLDRDILSVHVPSGHKKNDKLVQTLNRFCAKNMCKLVYFDGAVSSK